MTPLAIDNHNKLVWLTGLQMAISVIIIFILDHWLSLREGYWAAITIAVVTLPTFSPLLIKGIMRIIGTIVGALLGWAIAHVLGVSLFLLFGLLFLALLITSYLSLIPTLFSYAGVIAGVTMVIVLASTLQTGLLLEVAKYRSFEVILGVVIATLVGALIATSRKPKTAISALLQLNSHSIAAKPIDYFDKKLWLKSVAIAAAATLTFVPWAIWRYPQGFWASISCLLIMEESLHTTCCKASLRFIAHLLAASYGLLIYVLLLLLPWHNAWLLLPPLALGFFICGALVGRFRGTVYSSLGNTMGVAVSVMLLFGASITPSLDTIFHRFINVILGILLGIILSSLAE